MTSKLYVQKRGPSGGSNIDLTAFTGRKGTPFFDENNASLIQLGHRYSEAQASQGTFRLMDPEAELPRSDFNYNLPAHALLTWTEDAPGAEVWLSRGRIASSDGGRGLVAVDDEVDFDCTVDDCNCDLRGQAFTEAWVRPAETDVARLQALQAYTLNGSSSTATHHRDTCVITVSASHLAPNTNTVSMPAKKYLPGTQPADVVHDCADTAGKLYGVVIHHTGGSHLCLLYIVNNDHSTYLSPIKISDHLDEWDPSHPSAPVFEPHWEAGKASLYDGQTLLSGMVGVWQVEAGIFVEYAGNEESYDYWVDPYHDGVSTNSTQAAARTAGILEERRLTHVTHRVSIILEADQVDMVAAGMSLDVKVAAMLGGQYLDTWQTRRVAECQFEPRLDGRYWAHLQLDRPTLRVAPGRGSASSPLPPQPPVQSEPPAGPVTVYHWGFNGTLDDDTATYSWGNHAHASYTHTHVINPGMGNRSGHPHPPMSPGTYTVTVVLNRGVDGFNPGGIRLNVYADITAGPETFVGQSALVTSQSPVTESFSVTMPAGTATFSCEVPYNFCEVHDILITSGTASAGFEGTPPPPASTDSEGAIGTSPIYAPADHQHPWQTAESTPIADSGELFEGSNVEEALQELAAADDSRSWKMPVRVATTAAGTLASSFENGDTVDGITLATGDRILIKDQASGAENGIYTVNASGAPTRATDFDGTGEAEAAAVVVRDGTANGDTMWLLTNNGTVTIGSTTLVFAQFTGGGSGTLDDLTDVAITAPADGDLLVYDSGSGDWVNDAAAGGGTLDALSDVVISSPADGEILTYDSGSGDWINAAGGGGGAPDNALYVVGQANGTLTSEIAIPRMRVHRDRVPTSPDADDDEFDTPDAGSPPSGWSNLGTPDAVDISTTLDSHLYLQANAGSSYSLKGIYKAWTPSNGDTVSIRVSDSYAIGNFNMGGVFIAAATPVRVLAAVWTYDSGHKVGSKNWSALSGGSLSNNAVVADVPVPVYLQLRYNSSTSVDFLYSEGGRLWRPITLAVNPGITIGSVGLVVNAENLSHMSAMLVDWIRFNL